MNAIILAAGQGSRLLPLTADRPKCLVPVGGLTILEQQLAALREAGVNQATIVGGYRFDRLVEFTDRLPPEQRPQLINNPFFAVSSSIGSVWAARHLLDEPFCLLNGDSLFDARALKAAFDRLGNGVSLFVEPVEGLEHDDMLVHAERGRVLEVGKNLDPRRATHRSVGVIACRDADGDSYRAALEEVIAGPGGEQCFHHEIVDLLAKRGMVAAVEYEAGAWQEVDSPGDIDCWLGAADSAAA
jgi:choline kinase